MMPVLVTPATALAVSLDEVKANMRISGNRQDAALEAWIRGITRNAEKLMRRSLMQQDWKQIIPGFAPEILLAFPPVVSVNQVKFYDRDNVLQLLDPASYRVVGDQLLPAAGAGWPTTYNRPDAVEIMTTCGYGADATSTPSDIKLYLLAKVAEMFEPDAGNFPPTVGKPYKTSFIDSMLDDYRVYS
jgi:uncharacterized phiE125 gp8 family phage protein